MWPECGITAKSAVKTGTNSTPAAGAPRQAPLLPWQSSQLSADEAFSVQHAMQSLCHDSELEPKTNLICHPGNGVTKHPYLGVKGTVY